jgi:hypothetical protein
VKQPKRSTEPDVLVPCLFLDSPRDQSHKYKVSRTLDTEAVFNVASAFQSRGYRLGRSLYLHPPPERTPDEERAFPLTRKLSRGIRLVFGSRPGLDDNPEDNPRVMKPSFTELEELFLKVWRPRFRKLARPMLVLPPELSDLLPAEYANRDHIEFSQRQGSSYQRLSGGKKRVPKNRTCAFLLNLDDFYKGAALTSFFAMDGVAGLIWSELLRDRHAKWLTQPGFRMVELIGTKIPERMEDLSFVDAWEAVSLRHVQV